ncbi:MAG: uracil-DNA glycosylase [Tenericutes bacterium]|jgi:uracil-DNA glycosylase|nr:uracil-DNA glycosylase [Mycoplasmatota bacterium]
MKLNSNWKKILDEEIHQPYFKELMDFICKEYKQYTCYPNQEDIFNSLNLTPIEDVKVLVLGQDPYHQPNQAMGLAFSVSKEVKIPPSLRNIYKEMSDDLNIDIPSHGDLSSWAKQGVMLVNAIWTVRENQPLSHKDKGWERFSDSIISLLNQKEEPMVFILWGAFARNKKSLITNKKHLIIENVHPSPLSAYRGFFGAKPFSKINRFLKENNRQPINFKIRGAK